MEVPSGAKKVQRFLEAGGSSAQVILLPESTATAAQAAAAAGVGISNIGKTIAFRGQRSGTPIVVVIAGSLRISERLLEERVGEGVDKMSAADVLRSTGFPVGGVSPFGLPREFLVFVDERLLQLKECIVAAGHPQAVVRTGIEELVRLSGALVAALSQ